MSSMSWLMSCSTAPLTAQQWLQFEEMYGVTLLQMYGMSETGWVCGNRHYAKKMGTVGLPALHQELVIVDGEGKTCDLGIKDAEGFVRVSGRSKDLIIRGGVNIAPLEIDEVLLRHPDVLDAAAVGVPDPIYGEEIVCYVVPKPGHGLSEAAVTEHCQANLPAPKVPKQVFIVTELPKSDRGKVLRDKLKDDWNERAGKGRAA